MEKVNIFLTTRQQKGYTQVEVSKITGISQATISNIEKDDNFSNYPFDTIKKLCNFYCIDINKLK